MLASLKKLIGVDEGGLASKLFGEAKNEREALLLLKEGLSRDEKRRREIRSKIKELDNQEAKLLEEAKKETSEVRRLRKAREIKEIRQEIEDHERKGTIYNNRIRSYVGYIQSLETIVEVNAEEIPDAKTLENLSIQAKVLIEDLGERTEIATGIRASRDKAAADEEDLAVLQELKELRDAETAKKEAEKKEKEPKIKKKREKYGRPKEKKLEEEIIEEI